MITLLWHNNSKKSLPVAVGEATAAHLRRLGTKPTHVILPLGEYPPEVGGLTVETDKRVMACHLSPSASPKRRPNLHRRYRPQVVNYMQVYDGGETNAEIR